VVQQTPIEVRALASPAFLERGCVNVISLEAIKENAGPRWPRICQTVYSRLETLLRQRLGQSDFFARLDDETYIITMPSTDPEDVNIICMRVAYELYSNLLGQCDVNQIRVSKAVYAGENQMSLKPLSSERLVLLAEKAGIQDIPSSDQIPSADHKDDDAHRTVNIIEGETPATKTLTIVHQYVPIWSAINNAITTYICEPRQVMSLDIPRRNIMVPQLTQKERIRVELSSLREGINKLTSHIESGNRFILGVQVSFDVIGTPTGRIEFLNECRNLSYEYRQYLDFILTDVPQGVPHPRLNDLANTLRPFARSVSATVAPGTRNFATYQGVGLRGIGFSKQEFTNERPFTADDVTCLVHAARHMKLNSFVLGLRRLSTLQMVHDAGIQMIGGSAIAPAMAEPKGMTRLSWEDIMSSHELLSI
jgi:hypothetical protein